MNADNRATLVRRWPPFRVPGIEDLPAHIQTKIAEYNARPMRRGDDIRILGWDIVENDR